MDPEFVQPKTIPGPWEASHKIFISIRVVYIGQYSKFQLNWLSCFGEGVSIWKLFSLKPSPDQEEASHKISAQQVQPFLKQTTFYFYSLAIYINYYKNRFFTDFRQTCEWIRNIYCRKPSPAQDGGSKKNFSSIGPADSEAIGYKHMYRSILQRLVSILTARCILCVFSK